MTVLCAGAGGAGELTSGRECSRLNWSVNAEREWLRSSWMVAAEWWKGVFKVELDGCC